MANSFEQQLQNLSRWKTVQRRAPAKLGIEVVDIFKHDIEKKQKKFGHIGEVWINIVPAALQQCSELSTLSRGTLTVIVQGSTNLFSLKQAMLAGLQEQLLHACRQDGLKKVSLKPGKLST